MTSTFSNRNSPSQRAAPRPGKPAAGRTLCWARQDIEQRMLFRGGRFTRVNTWLSLLLGGMLAVAFYAILTFFVDERLYFVQMFTQRGPTPYFICFFASWSAAILFLKWNKLRLQRKSLRLKVVPEEVDFILSPGTVQTVFDRIYQEVEDPKQFVLLNRIMVALGNLRNLGQVGDVDEILRSQAEHDESVMETSYALLRGFIWAIPVLGFIGTVLGLSTAIGGFGRVLGSGAEMTEIASSLKVVTGGLATAFETTLVALVAALAIQIVMTMLRKGEEEFLDDCTEYCQRHVVTRLRLMPFQPEAV